MWTTQAAHEPEYSRNLTILQSCNLTTLTSAAHSTCPAQVATGQEYFPECYNLTILQSCNLAILQSYNLAILQSVAHEKPLAQVARGPEYSPKSYNLTILQSYNLTILQSYNLTILQSYALAIHCPCNM